jgi:hypothetical protein
VQLSLRYYNYYAIVPWKDEELINELTCLKINCCIIIASELKTGLLYKNLYAPYIHSQSTMFNFLRNCTVVTFDNYFKIVVNVSLTQQLVYNVHTCDHAMCPHFHNPLWDTFTTNFLLWFPLIQLIGPLMHHYWITNVKLCCDYCVTIYNLIRIQIHM